jgi:uridine kinase
MCRAMQLKTYSEWVATLRAKVRTVRSARRESERDGEGCMVIGIDGAGGSGKSTIARQLALAAPDIQVIALDDFYRPSRERYAGPIAQRPIAADYDLERLRREVLEPLASGRPAAYRRYDWEADAVGTERVVVEKPSVVLEGIYSSSATLAPFLDAVIWVECPRELRLARGLARDGEPARARWELDWMPGEDLYLEKEGPRERADFVCDGGRGDLSARIALLQQR